MGSSASSGKLAIPRKHSSVSLQHFLPYFILILNLLNLISNLIPRKHPSVSLQHFLCPIFASHLMNMMALQEQGLRCSRFEQERAQETREFSLIGLSRPVLQEDAETWDSGGIVDGWKETSLLVSSSDCYLDLVLILFVKLNKTENKH